MPDVPKGILTVFLALGFTNIQTLASEPSPLTMVVSNWAPYKGMDLPEGGIVVDLAKRALVRAGHGVSIRHAPWKHSLKGAYDGTYDVIPAIWLSPERAEKLAFSVPVVTSRIVIISHVDAGFRFDGLDDLRGRTVGTSAGWAYPKAFVEATDILKEEVRDLDTNLRKIVHGRIKLVIGEELAARYTVRWKLNASAHLFRYSAKSLDESDLRVAFSRKLAGVDGLVARFNDALSSLRADGTYDAVLRFHGVDKGPQ